MAVLVNSQHIIYDKKKKILPLSYFLSGILYFLHKIAFISLHKYRSLIKFLPGRIVNLRLANHWPKCRSREFVLKIEYNFMLNVLIKWETIFRKSIFCDITKYKKTISFLMLPRRKTLFGAFTFDSSAICLVTAKNGVFVVLLFFHFSIKIFILFS